MKHKISSITFTEHSIEVPNRKEKKRKYEIQWSSIVLTPNTKVERCELRKIISPSRRLSEKRSEMNTRYSDIIVIKMAWTLDIPLQ